MKSQIDNIKSITDTITNTPNADLERLNMLALKYLPNEFKNQQPGAPQEREPVRVEVLETTPPPRQAPTQAPKTFRERMTFSDSDDESVISPPIARKQIPIFDENYVFKTPNPQTLPEAKPPAPVKPLTSKLFSELPSGSEEDEIIVEQGRKQFKCKTCGNDFKSLTGLQSHERAHLRKVLANKSFNRTKK